MTKAKRELALNEDQAEDKLSGSMKSKDQSVRFHYLEHASGSPTKKMKGHREGIDY